MQPMYYIGLDVHKQKISYCVKDSSGKIYAEGWILATRFDLDRWMKTRPQPWSAVMEATMFSGWIYDYLKPHAAELKVAHPLMLRAIAATKKKNDRIDAGGGQETGRLLDGRGSRADPFSGGGPRNLYRRLGWTKQFFQHEACQVLPLNQLGTEQQLPMLLLISFETGRKTQTQSSGQPDALHQQMEVWFYPRIETAGREANTMR